MLNLAHSPGIRQLSQQNTSTPTSLNAYLLKPNRSCLCSPRLPLAAQKTTSGLFCPLLRGRVWVTTPPDLSSAPLKRQLPLLTLCHGKGVS